jgi:hypothetical protein
MFHIFPLNKSDTLCFDPSVSGQTHCQTLLHQQPTLSAIKQEDKADFCYSKVIELSLCQKTHLVYGGFN